MHRRSFLVTASALGLSTLARADEKKDEPEVSPVEDLMQEHGVLERLLLVYEEGVRQLESKGAPFPAITKASELIKRFVEDYHEKNEEQFLFPRFDKDAKLKELVAVLRKQHDAGRQLTSRIHSWSTSPNASGDLNRKRMAEAMRSFVRMYRPHAAREDTVLFPAFRELLPEKEYEALGEQFEEQEHKLFGEHGFQRIVAEVAAIEATLGIANLADFTPKP
jgi:hemerythrin-like domain-containing protein